ncbi:hypothetical protein [Herbaspirillum rubrisubalbicans]|uniref:hypothetical protein n=1 Tax=Herbaspirillum rubrisubalbicans TaxID=80842 RepID=UPI0012F658B9|nr:hypothetical protein [Herbaspirillum rubrisubalbicans]
MIHKMAGWKRLPLQRLVGIIGIVLVHAACILLIANNAPSRPHESKDAARITAILYPQEAKPSSALPSPPPPRNESAIPKPASLKKLERTPPQIAPPRRADSSLTSTSNPHLSERSDTDKLQRDSLRSPDSSSPALLNNAPHLVLDLPAEVNKSRGLHPGSHAAELANENRHLGKQKDALAEGIKSAAIADCLHDNQGGGLLGIPLILYKAANGKCK